MSEQRLKGGERFSILHFPHSERTRGSDWKVWQAFPSHECRALCLWCCSVNLPDGLMWPPYASVYNLSLCTEFATHTANQHVDQAMNGSHSGSAVHFGPLARWTKSYNTKLLLSSRVVSSLSNQTNPDVHESESYFRNLCLKFAQHIMTSFWAYIAHPCCWYRFRCSFYINIYITTPAVLNC